VSITPRVVRFALLMMATALGAIMIGASPALAAEYEGQPSEAPNDYNEADDAFLGGPDPPCMLPVAMLILFVFLILLAAAMVVGIVVAVVTLAVTAVLVAVGVVSFSAAVGLLSRRPSHAARALFIQLGALSGILCGIGAALFATWLGNLGIHRGLVVLIGGATGLAYGLGVALLFNFAWTRATQWIVARINRWRGKKPEAQAAEPPRTSSDSETSAEAP